MKNKLPRTKVCGYFCPKSAFFSLALNLFLLLASNTYANKGSGDYGEAAATITTSFPAGVYIIDMGQTTQTINNGLKPYGLVYALINAEIPVNWAIEPTKAKDGIDFYATTAANGNKAYRGGSFIINTVAYPAAVPIINSWKAANVGLVVDGPTTTSFSAPIYKTLTIWPRAFLDSDNDTRIIPYYANAGVPSSSYQINSDPTDLPSCGSNIGTQDIYILPHADPQDWDASFVVGLQNFINNGGAMWASCHAVSAIENIPGCNFLSSTGLVLWTDHNDPAPPYTYRDSGNPAMQFMGILDNATASGSEEIYLPKTTWRASTSVAVYDPNYINTRPNPDVSYLFPTNPAAAVAYGPAFGNKGMVMYQGGHNLNNTNNGSTVAERVAAQRAFFNFLLIAGTQPSNTISQPVILNQTTTICSGLAFNLNPSGNSINYTWTAPTGTGFTGGFAQNIPQSNISQVLTNTTLNPVTATYIVTPRVGNCLGNPFTLTVTVYPTTNMTVTPTLSSVCLGNSTTITASGASSYNWSPSIGLNTTTGSTVIATPTTTTTYTVTEGQSNSYGCSSSQSITITVIAGAIVATAAPNPICIGSTLNLSSSVGAGTSSRVLISEGFNAATNNWTTSNTSTGGIPTEAAWTLRPDRYRIDCSGDQSRLRSNDDSQFYLSNSCEQGNGGITQTILQSPAFSTVGLTTLSMNFYHYLKFFTGASAKVEVSTNGTTWTTVANYNSLTIGTRNNFAQQVVNLNAFVGNAVLYVRFKYDAPWSWYWAIDNVTISGNSNSPINWTGPNGFTSVEQNPVIPNITALNAGVYTLNYTAPAGCTATTTVNVTVNSLPTINVLASPTSICIGESTTITATGALTYSWTPDTGLSATAGDIITAEPLTTTNYTVTGTDANGCSNSANIDITVKALPTISITPASALICTSIGTALTASGATSYSWSPSTGLSATTGTAVNASPSIDTTYTVTGTANGCFNSETVFVAVIPSPPTTGVTICPGETGVLSSSAICPPGNSTTAGFSNAGTGNSLTAGIGTLAWTNPGNAISSNSIFATVAINGPGTQSSQYLRTTNYGFSIPLNANIIGITVRIGRCSSDVRAGADIKDLEVNLLKGGAMFGSNLADTSTEWPKGPSISAKNYGGNTETWGVTWTPTDINDANFGVSLRANSDNDRTATVDYMRISVTYTIPGVLNWFTTVSGGTPIGSGSPFNPVGVANSGLANTNTPGTYTFYAECSSDTRCRTATNFTITPIVGTPLFSLGTSSIRCQAANALTYVATATSSTGITYSLDALSLAAGNNIVPGTGVVTYTSGWNGISVVTATATGCNGPKIATHTITTLGLPSAPIVGTITQTTCSVATGTVVLNELPLGGVLNPGNISYAGTSHLVPNLSEGTYNFTVTSNTCTSLPSANVIINPASALVRVWNGTINNDWNNQLNWSPNSVPTSDNCVVITNASNAPIVSGTAYAAYAYGLTIQSGGVLQVNPSNSIIVTNIVDVKPGGQFNLKNNSSLIQINNVANLGTVNIERITQPMYRFDYTYWGTPVTAASNFTLGMLSPLTLPDKYFSWIPTVANSFGSWFFESAATEMNPIKGYIVRAPQTFSPSISTKVPYTANFIGTPNNGDIFCPIYFGGLPLANNNDKYNLLGNPYASAVDAELFLSDPANIPVIDGTIYFWTHNSPPSANNIDPFYGDFLINYAANDYASWNRLGGTGTTAAAGSGGAPPSGFIASGQGFFTKSTGTATSGDPVVFRNSMRVNFNNDQFFRNSIIDANTNRSDANTNEKHRIWLNLVSNGGSFNQILVGYATDATNEFDRDFDGVRLTDNNSITFHSKIADRNLVIQGRALPFSDQDQVPLGYKSTVNDTFSIRIDHFDGLFENQSVYIEDQLLNIIHDLKLSPYVFTSAIGVFDDRFILRFTTNEMLSQSEFEVSSSLVSSINDEKLFVVSSEFMTQIDIYDISGKQVNRFELDQPEKRFANHISLAEGIYVLKAKLKNGMIMSRKLINKK